MPVSFAASMKELLIIEKLRNVDRELHSIMDELKPKKHAMSLEEIREAFSKSVKSDIDPTKLIRKMRDRKYDL